MVQQSSASPRQSDLAILTYIALATIVVHLFTGNRYGFQRDELATLDDARHLAWGYVAYPPMTPFFGRISLTLFGTSLVGFRFFAAIVQAVAVILTGLMAREMGGGRSAQLVAAVAAIPFCLAGGALMQYVSFDYFCWVLTAYFVVRLLQSEDPRWWLAIGSGLGLGMMAKYNMGFLALGIVAAVVLTDARKYFTSKWLWYGVAASLIVFLPNLIWQAQHHFISLDFLREIHERDVRIGRTNDFLPGQLRLTLFGLVLAILGLYFCLLTTAGRRFRMLGWMYVVPLTLFVIAHGRSYYLAGAYPMLFAAGSVWSEQKLRDIRPARAAWIRGVAWTVLAIDIVVMIVLTLPVAPLQSAWFYRAAKVQDDFLEELGWPELVAEVARIRDSLSPDERSRLGVLAANYGEAGAINLYGPGHGLPQAISGVNSFWARGYGNPPPQTLIVLGFSRKFIESNFEHCDIAGHTPNPYNVQNEETRDHPDIYVCRGLRQSWPDFWSDFHYYG
jgi:4-amino-4-deoxy-L-arabinose transferase-like glycosyltransferase